MSKLTHYDVAQKIIELFHALERSPGYPADPEWRFRLLSLIERCRTMDGSPAEIWEAAVLADAAARSGPKVLTVGGRLFTFSVETQQ